MSEDSAMLICAHCGESWDKNILSKSCSNCFACTGCEAYICPECQYEIVVVPPRPMKKTNSGE